MSSNETLQSIIKWNRAYERFKKEYNTVETVVPFSLLVNWDSFSWETWANILEKEIEKRYVDDKGFEMWVRSPSYSWIGQVERLPLMLSNKGRLYDLDTEKMLPTFPAPNGEIVYAAKREWMLISRAVALNFVSRKKELEGYNYAALSPRHKNEQLHDNSSSNLEWVVPSDEVLKQYTAHINGDAPAMFERKAILITLHKPPYNGDQFVFAGNKAMQDLGLDSKFIHGATLQFDWKHPFRARYLGPGEALGYPQTPPEGLDLELLKPPAMPKDDPWDTPTS